MPVSLESIETFFANTPQVPEQQLKSSLLDQKRLTLTVRREDLLHPEVPGNKWRKLKYNLLAAAGNGSEALLTFGGAYSNHLAAVSAAGKLFGFKTIGFVRGEAHFPLNPTLEQATRNAMELHYLDRETYRQKDTPEFLEQLKSRFPDAYLIPEGGTNNLALQGCAEITRDIQADLDVICCAAGTGGTAAGLLCGLNGKKDLLVFTALKGDFLKNEINHLTQTFNGNIYKNWNLQTDYHFGGYAKIKSGLLDFMHDFQDQFNIPLEPVYTGKMFFGLFDMIGKDFFEPGTKILAIHTGGLQGLAGFEERLGLRF